MRIKIKFSKNAIAVPNQNQGFINSYIHKVLGKNNIYHDAKDNSSISSLKGGIIREDKMLDFPDGGYIVASSIDPTFLNKLLVGLFKNKILGFGMEFITVDHIEEQFYDGWNYFFTLTPFIIKRKLGIKKYDFVTLEEDNFEDQVKSYLIKKLKAIDNSLDLSTFDVKIPDLPGNRVKNVVIHKKVKGHDVFIKNMANQCPINIFCSKKIASLLYHIGIGQSTSCGFGTIYKTENKVFYGIIEKEKSKINNKMQVTY